MRRQMILDPSLPSTARQERGSRTGLSKELLDWLIPYSLNKSHLLKKCFMFESICSQWSWFVHTEINLSSCFPFTPHNPPKYLFWTKIYLQNFSSVKMQEIPQLTDSIYLTSQQLDKWHHGHFYHSLLSLVQCWESGGIFFNLNDIVQKFKL